jgi:outer membrane biosynthesis protein TonB
VDNLPSNDQSSRKAFGVSVGLHGALFITILCTTLFSPPPPPTPRTIFVRTVSLKSGSAIRTVASPKTTTAQAPAQKQSEAPPGPPKQAEEIVAENEPEEPSAGPKKVEEAAHERGAPAQKSATPSKIPTTSKANSSGTATASKKATPTTSSKTAQGKGKPVSKGSTSTQKASSQYDQKLLGEALRRLDRSKSAASHGGKGGSEGGSVGGSGGVAHVGTVGSLNVESGLSVGRSDSADEGEGYATASPEACYIGDLIRRLQLNIRLPEPGEVRVKLTLKKSGSISSVQVISGSKNSIKDAIEKKLKAVHFSPFGTSFPGESEHTFNLRLSNDLIWSCR